MTSDNLHSQRSALMATVQLPLAAPDWPRFRAVLADAAHDGWAVHDASHAFALAGGLSHAAGAHIGFKQWAWTCPPEPVVTLYVVAPRGEEAWRPAAVALLRRFAETWPGAVG